MSQPLFRREVFDAKRGSWLGGISLAQPLSLWVLTAFATAAAVAIGLFLVFGTYTRRSTVLGQLVPKRGLATVLSPATGVVYRVDIAEGGKVQAGRTLAVIGLPRATVSSGDTHAALQAVLQERERSLHDGQAAQRSLFVAQGAGLHKQLITISAELAQIKAQTSTRREQARIAQETLERLRQLQGEKFVSTLQVKQQEAVVLEQQAAVQLLQQQAISTRRGIAQLRQALQELPGQRQASDADYQRNRALLNQEQVETDARGALAVTAPVTGVVATQIAKPGQAVQVGQPMMSLLAGDGALEAELLVPSRAIGFIEPGDPVLLRYQAYPYQKFGHQLGKVARISRSALSPSELGALVGNAQGSEPFYRVTVALARQAITAYGKPEVLKPGMLLEADVLGEKRRLIEWVFEPLYSLMGKVGSN